MSKERTFKDSYQNNGYSTYDECIDESKRARNTQRNDTNPYIEKEGYLGVDDLDKMRRRRIR